MMTAPYVFLAYLSAAMTGAPVYQTPNLSLAQCMGEMQFGEKIWREHFSDHPHPGFICRPEDRLHK